jgi:glycosyltransferase involved in cell wall biosynthesis
MTKKTKTAQAASAKKPMLPLVSVCTPTFNRRPFIPIMFECFRNQTYPKSRIEWIIIDDGTDKIGDLVDAANIPQIKYFTVDKKMTLGAKRNMIHEKSRGSILVYMDDDDYYPPERISHAVETLMRNPQALCVGSSEIYLYIKNVKGNLKNSMYQFGPYGPNHATAATFAFRRELLKLTRYDSTVNVAEERAFLKDYTIPFAQLDPLKTILVFTHEHNSVDKRTLLVNPNPNTTKPSNKTVDMFIKFPHEAHIKKFFLEDIDRLLSLYAPGEPRMKPDVMKQMQEIKEKREKEAKEMAEKAAAAAAQGGPQFMMPPTRWTTRGDWNGTKSSISSTNNNNK